MYLSIFHWYSGLVSTSMTEYTNAHQYSEINSAFTTKCSLIVFGVLNYLFFRIILFMSLHFKRKVSNVLAVFIQCFWFRASLYSSIKWQTDATFDSFYFLSNYLLNVFRVTSAHHQEFSLLYIQPPVICVAACPWHCLLVNCSKQFTTRQCHGHSATQITGGCMYSKENS
jgi:hypothetical protein